MLFLPTTYIGSSASPSLAAMVSGSTPECGCQVLNGGLLTWELLNQEFGTKEDVRLTMVVYNGVTFLHYSCSL